VRGPAGPARARRATLGALGYRVVALDGPRWASLHAHAGGAEAGGSTAGEVLAALLGPNLLSGVGEEEEEEDGDGGGGGWEEEAEAAEAAGAF
jgi:hypothetical protein